MRDGHRDRNTVIQVFENGVGRRLSKLTPWLSIVMCSKRKTAISARRTA